MTPETLRKWIRQAEIDEGAAEGTTTDAARQIRELKRNNAELERTVEILKAATTFFRAGARLSNSADVLVHRSTQAHLRRRAWEERSDGVCRVLTEHGWQIAPRTYYAHRSRPLSARALWDMTITEVLAGIYDPQPALDGSTGKKAPESLYGSRKMWAHLNRQGIPVARCTVERLMADHGWQGVRRQRKVRTTVADPSHVRAADLLQRDFTAVAPNIKAVSDFTYVRLTSGVFCYTAFVIDAFAGVITGWNCSQSKGVQLVSGALRDAGEYRRRQGHPMPGDTVAHSDAGSEYTAVHYTEAVFLEGMVPSIGTVGDAYDNALAETTIGLYKTECIRLGSPFRAGPLTSVSDVENATAAWVHWYNTSRLMHRLGLIPPVEAEAAYYHQQQNNRPVVHT